VKKRKSEKGFQKQDHLRTDSCIIFLLLQVLGPYGPSLLAPAGGWRGAYNEAPIMHGAGKKKMGS